MHPSASVLETETVLMAPADSETVLMPASSQVAVLRSVEAAIAKPIAAPSPSATMSTPSAPVPLKSLATPAALPPLMPPPKFAAPAFPAYPPPVPQGPPPLLLPPNRSPQFLPQNVPPASKPLYATPAVRNSNGFTPIKIGIFLALVAVLAATGFLLKNSTTSATPEAEDDELILVPESGNPSNSGPVTLTIVNSDGKEIISIKQEWIPRIAKEVGLGVLQEVSQSLILNSGGLIKADLLRGVLVHDYMILEKSPGASTTPSSLEKATVLFIDQFGKMTTDPRFTPLSRFHEGLAAVKSIENNNHLCGYINRSHQVVIPFEFVQCGDFHEGLSLVKRASAAQVTREYINLQGKTIISGTWDEAGYFSEGKSCIRSGTKWGFINRDGKEVIPPQFDLAGNFEGGLAWVRVTGLYGYIDSTGKLSIPATYSKISTFKHNAAIVKDTSGIQLLSRSGKPLNTEPLIFADWTVDGNLLIRTKSSKWGLMGPSGENLLKPEWDYGGSAFANHVFFSPTKGAKLAGASLNRDFSLEFLASLDNIKGPTPEHTLTLVQLVSQLSLQINRKLALRIGKIDFTAKNPQAAFYFQSTTGNRTRKFSLPKGYLK